MISVVRSRYIWIFVSGQIEQSSGRLLDPSLTALTVSSSVGMTHTATRLAAVLTNAAATRLQLDRWINAAVGKPGGCRSRVLAEVPVTRFAYDLGRRSFQVDGGEIHPPAGRFRSHLG